MRKTYLLKDFEPRTVLRHFEDICAIPHGTGHEAALRSHIAELASKYGLSSEQDEAGNLLVRIPASTGCETAPPFLIQGHLDMVLAGEPWVERDLVKEPVKLVLEGNILRADGTTLGADNAVGLCHMMALMELSGTDPSAVSLSGAEPSAVSLSGAEPSAADFSAFRHPPLELLFTVEEESGLTGIRKADLSRIRSRRMLNMDCGDPDCLVIGAAGGSKYLLSGEFPLLPVCPVGNSNGKTGDKYMGKTSDKSTGNMEGKNGGKSAGKTSSKTDECGLRIEINGLRGGHSGIEAGRNRASAVELTGRLLSALCDRLPVRLSSMDSPPAANSFPRWQKTTLSIPASRLDEAKQILALTDQSFRRELAGLEPDYRMSVSACEVSSAASAADTRALADFLLLVPCGALRRSTDRPDWVLCSALLSSASFTDGVFKGFFSIRANRDFYRDAAAQRLDALCRMAGLKASLTAEPTPAWVETDHSPLRDLCLTLYRDLFGQEMRVQVENGSVEVSVITAAIPDMDAIGFAPKSRGAHTTDEHLYLETMPVFWSLLTALLSRLCDPLES